jgi:hypothetical protein
MKLHNWKDIKNAGMTPARIARSDARVTRASLAIRLRTLRKTAGMTQLQLAKAESPTQSQPSGEGPEPADCCQHGASPSGPGPEKDGQEIHLAGADGCLAVATVGDSGWRGSAVLLPFWRWKDGRGGRFGARFGDLGRRAGVGAAAR